MNTHIRVENTEDLQDTDILSIAEIEQDGWAHGLGEYVKCDDCGHIHSKEDIYNKLPKEVSVHTVKQIRQKLGDPEILCHKCNGLTSEIYGQDYIEEVRERYKKQSAFLVTCRFNNGEIQGFLDGYIDNFDFIYKDEFESYYEDIGKEAIIEHIEDTLGKDIPKHMLMTSALCINEKYRSLHTVYALMKAFYSDVEKRHPVITGIYESGMGTNIHAIHKITGGKTIGLRDIDKSNIHRDHASDIMVHENIGAASKLKLEKNLKTFLTVNKGRMRKIIEMSKK